MTGTEARALVAAVELPDGWSLSVIALRVYRYRSEWSLTVFHDGVIATFFRGYRLAEMTEVAKAYVAERTAVVA
jgi:hypothetical protein